MKIYLVGGAVRDELLNIPVKERDYVVVGATVAEMLKLGYRQVGKEFPVFLDPKKNEEYALARMERKVKPGYSGFEFDTAPSVTLEEDLLRRDLTINAMAKDMKTGEIIDPYHGREDLQNHLLRHVSPAFAEDPVRILRVGRFLARYADRGFNVAPETISLMRQMTEAGEVDALVAERVWKELERALGEPRPEKFFEVLDECGALKILFPAMTLKNAGMQALKSAAQKNKTGVVRFAALLHDYSLEDIKKLCDRYRVPNAYRELAQLCVKNHELFAEINDELTLGKLHPEIATQIESFLSKTDAFRREDRFKDLLNVYTVTFSTFQKNKLEWIIQCFQIAKSIEVSKLIDQGFTGTLLAEKIRETRKDHLFEFIRSSTL